MTPPAHIPTLLAVAGRYDAANLALPDACRQELDSFATTQFDCGHHIHLERLAEAGTLIRNFLNETPTSHNETSSEQRPSNQVH